MRAWYRWGLTGSLLAAGAGALLLLVADVGEHGTIEVRRSIDDPSPGLVPADPGRHEPAPAGSSTIAAPLTAAPARENPQATANTAGDALASNSFLPWMDASVDAVLNATPDEYRKTRTRAEQGDAEAAFWLHW